MANEETPTLEQAVAAIKMLREELDTLKAKKKEKGKTLRPKRPDPYDGDPRKMDKYFTELDIYFGYFPSTLEEDEDKTIFAITCLTGTAEEWARPIMKDYEANASADWQAQTQEVFKTHQDFREQLKKSFGTANEEQEAEKLLNNMHQKGPLSKNTTAFIRLLTKVNWTEESKKDAYYRMVRPKVKDELCKVDRKKTSFLDYTQQAIVMDNRIWERDQEKKEEGKPGNFHAQRNNANQGKKRDLASSNDGRPGPMDLSTIKEQRKNVECFNCGKKGHIKKYCRAPKKQGNKEWTPVPEPKDKKVNTINIVPHESLSWTRCYDNMCQTHLSEKQGAGWFPKAPKERKPLNVIQRKDEYGNDGVTDQDMNELSNKLVNLARLEEQAERYEEQGDIGNTLTTLSKACLVLDDIGTTVTLEEDNNSLPDTAPWENYEEELSEGETCNPCYECGSRRPRGPYHTCGMTDRDLERYYTIQGIVKDYENLEIQERMNDSWKNIPRIDSKKLPKPMLKEPCKDCGSLELYGPYHPCGMTDSDYEHEQEACAELDQDEDLEELKNRPYKEERELQKKLLELGPFSKEAEKLIERYEYGSRGYVPPEDNESLPETTDDILFSLECGQTNPAFCKTFYCKSHVTLKIAEWHELHNPPMCDQQEFTLCNVEDCVTHFMQRRALRTVIKNLFE